MDLTRPFCCREPRRYWRKLTLLRKRHVVPLDVNALLAKRALPAKIRHGGEARERQEIVNQVRLVEISAVHGLHRPVWGLRSLSDKRERLLEPLHAAEEFRFQAHLGG